MGKLIQMVGALVALAVTGYESAPPPGWYLLVRVDSRRIAGQDVSESAERVMAEQLPGGSAETEYVTDGTSVRSTTKGDMFGLRDGTVRLVLGGSADLIVLDPPAKSYSVVGRDWGTFAGAEPDVSVRPTTAFRQILGRRVRRVSVSLAQKVKLSSASDRTLDVRAEIESWCASEPSLPQAMRRMMDVTTRFVGSSDQYARACPVVFESTVRISVLPGFEMRSAVQEIRPVAAVPSGTFEVPPSYERRDGGRH